MMMDKQMMDDEAEKKVLEEIMKLMGGSMGDRVKPKMLSVEMKGMSPDSSEEEKSESPIEKLKEVLDGEETSGMPDSDNMDMKSMEDELASKGVERSGDRYDPEDEENMDSMLRKKGRIF